MASAVSIAPKSALHFPPGLARILPNYKTPWHLSPDLFRRAQELASKDPSKPFVSCPVLPTEKEAEFVKRYFMMNPPPGVEIQSIECVHNAIQTQAFEAGLLSMQEAAKSLPATWRDEEPRELRANAMEGWRTQVTQFNPVHVSSPKRETTCTDAYVLPLLHGTKYETVKKICSGGFTYFGKHHYFDPTAKAGAPASTDIGFFANGVYFTNAFRYAAMYSPDGTIVMAFVAHREPYPVVNDVPIPQKGKDMRRLEGQGAYRAYNCHFVQVASEDPKDPECMVYYARHKEYSPWDEFVVFHASQALPRFIIRVGVHSIFSLAAPITTIKTLLAKVLDLLDHEQIQQDKELNSVLSEKAKFLG